MSYPTRTESEAAAHRQRLARMIDEHIADTSTDAAHAAFSLYLLARVRREALA